MKKLSEFRDEQGAIVVAKLLKPIFAILQNASNANSRSGTAIDFVTAMLSNSPKDVLEIFAILNETEPDEYHTNAAMILGDVVTLASDDELMALFGLQRQTQTSSGSASTSSDSGAQE